MNLPIQPMPSVLIGIVTHNRAILLERAIQSCCNQRFLGARIAVVDAGSTDETPAVRRKFPSVQWSLWPEAHRYVEARNHLMTTATSTYFLSLDDDAWFLGSDEIENAVSHLEANPLIAAVAFDILTPDRPDALSRQEAQTVATFIGCGHLLRLSAAREAGFYAPGPGFYGGEEKDLAVRLLDLGWEIHKLPGVHVWHEKSSVARDGPAQHRSGVCNDLVFAVRRCPMPSLFWILPLKVLSHLRFALRNRLVGPCLEGIGAFLGSVVEIWPTRDPVRAATFADFRRRSRA